MKLYYSILNAFPKDIHNIVYRGNPYFLSILQQHYSISIKKVPHKEDTVLFCMALHTFSKEKREEIFISLQNTAKEYIFIDYTLVNRNIEYVFAWYKYIQIYILSHNIYPIFSAFMQEGALEGSLYNSPFVLQNSFRIHRAQIALYHCIDKKV